MSIRQELIGWGRWWGLIKSEPIQCHHILKPSSMRIIGEHGPEKIIPLNAHMFTGITAYEFAENLNNMFNPKPKETKCKSCGAEGAFKVCEYCGETKSA